VSFISVFNQGGLPKLAKKVNDYTNFYNPNDQDAKECNEAKQFDNRETFLVHENRMDLAPSMGILYNIASRKDRRVYILNANQWVIGLGMKSYAIEEILSYSPGFRQSKATLQVCSYSVSTDFRQLKLFMLFHNYLSLSIFAWLVPWLTV
jgi:hypothetical protein